MNQHVQTAVHFATVEGRVLAAALKPISFVISRNAKVPILAMVRLRLDGTTLTLSGTDLDIDISSSLDVNECGGEWELCTNAETLESIARVAGPMLVRMEVGKRENGDTVLLVTLDDGDTVYSLSDVLTGDLYPRLPGDRGDIIERFGNGGFPAHLARVERCVSREETRYYLNGVCWSVGPNGRWFAATDGHRLLKLDYAKDAGPENKRIIPRKTVELLTRFFAGAEAAIYAVGDSKIDIEIGGATIRSKLIEGTYPDIERVIPKAEKVQHTITAQRADLESALRKLSPIRYQKRFSGTAIRFHNVGGHLTLSVRSNDIGTVDVHLQAAWPEGLADFGVNRTYLGDVLRSCDSELRLGLSGEGAPIRVEDSDDTLTRVQMPMRV